MKKLVILAALGILIYACSDNAPKQRASTPETSSTETATTGYDTARGVGKFTNVSVSPNLDKTMIAPGQKVYEVKCAACHKLTVEKLVGPGWLGVTTRHRPEWIMNFVTNVEEMLQKDPKAQAMLELCLVQMPNQNLTDDEARHVFEFMRKNDGAK